MKTFFKIFLLKASNYLLLLFITFVLFLVGCSKDDSSEDKNISKIELEQLGNLTLSLSTGYKVFFDHSGNPVTYYGGYMYKWAPSTKEWTKIGNGMLDAAPKQFAEDNLGDCYALLNSKIYKLNKNNGKWEYFIFNDGFVDIDNLFCNANGDIICYKYYNAIFQFYKKEADSTNWVKIAEIESYYSTIFPNYLTDNGYLLFEQNAGSYAPGLGSKMLDTKTGEMVQLWDETDPINGEFGDRISNYQICSNGNIYTTKGSVSSRIYSFYKLTTNNIPSKFEKIQTYDASILTKELNVRFNGYCVDSNGSMKIIFLCSKPYGDRYYAYATANINSSELFIKDHPLYGDHIALLSNRQEDVYIFNVSNPILFKWK